MDNDTDAPANERRATFGAAIRGIRAERTQAELGRLLGVPQTTISRWEAGMVDLGYDQVASIERTLGVPMGTLAMTAGYFDMVLLSADTTVIRDVSFDRIGDALDAARGAANMEFGVRLFNRWVPTSADGSSHAEEWVVVLTGDAPHAAQ